MDVCRFCRFTRSSHPEYCPELLTGKDRATAIERWTAGKEQGRSGSPSAINGHRPELSSSDLQYLMGFHLGEAALEEAQNSSRW